MNINNGNDGFELLFGGNENAPKVLIFTEHVNATYYISFDIPLKNLHQKGEVNFAVVSQNYMAEKGAGVLEQWYQDFLPNIVVMTRYALPYGKEILDFFKSRGVPVIYHIDDDLLYIPESLGAEIQKRQGAIEVVEARRYLLQSCDLIYASTQFLANLLQKRFPQQKVIHGAIYASFIEGLATEKNTTENNETITIGYMGSKGHQHDLELVEDGLVKLMHEIPQLRFEVFGTIKMPPKLEQFGDRVKSHRVNKNYFEFIEYLAGLKWDIGLAPLVDEEFNHCKAPTKYIEYTSAGIPVVATDIDVYRNAASKDGIAFIYNNEWYLPLKELIESKVKRFEMLANAKRSCTLKYARDNLEAQLTEILNKMI